MEIRFLLILIEEVTKYRAMLSMSSNIRQLLDKGSNLLSMCLCFHAVLSCFVQVRNLLGGRLSPRSVPLFESFDVSNL